MGVRKMDVIKNFKQLFCGKYEMVTQISLFAIVGMASLAFVKDFASWINLMFEHTYVSVPKDDMSVWRYSFTSLLLTLYLLGYGLNLIHNRILGEKHILPQISLSPFVYLFKSFPVICCWIFYYFAIFIAGVIVLINLRLTLFLYLFTSIMICLIPFVMVVIAEYTTSLEYHKSNFNLANVFRVLEGSLGDVISLSLQSGILAVILGVIIHQGFMLPVPSENESIFLICKLILVCVSSYLWINFFYVYLVGVADIAKKYVKL
jgi:hypothetical protein